MISRVCLLSLLCCCSLLLAAAPQVLKKDAPPVPAVPAGPDDPVVIRLAPQAKVPLRALEWSFQPDELDRVPGNAAQMWLRAGTSARSVRHKWTQDEDKWYGPGPEGTALKDLPRKEMREVLDKFATALRQAKQASLRTRCEWETPPLTMQTLGDVPFDDVQILRELVRLVSLRCRLAQAEGRFDEAHEYLRVGLTMSRHVGASEYLIQDLVAIALGAIMLGRIDEWVQVPGSPNLYWALTEMPRPLVDVRRSIRSELNTIYRSFPMLRDFKAKKLSAGEAQALVEKFLEAFGKLGGEQAPGWLPKLGTTALALKYYPAAKKALIERGRPEKEVNAIPAVQAVVLNYLEEYDRVRDEFLKCLTLPDWQCYPMLEKVDKAERARAKETGNVLIGNLMPAMVKVHHAYLRIERLIAALRAAEALRLHVAKHGRPPAKWADITEVPLPIDPYTGKGFDEWYSFKGNKAVLDVPPPPGMPGRLGRRFEVVLQGG